MIRWRELPYEQASWEAGEMDIPGMIEAQQTYWEHRYIMNNEQPPKRVLKDLKTWNKKEIDKKKPPTSVTVDVWLNLKKSYLYLFNFFSKFSVTQTSRKATRIC